MSEELLAALRARGATLAVSESCTGGLLGGALTSVAGSSDVFLGGAVAYSDESKVTVLGVDADKIEKFGSVSGAVAEAMAHGVKDLFGSDMAIAITGIAGPDGGSAGKPVGTVWMAALGPTHLIDVHRFHFEGSREEIRHAAVEEACAMALGMLDEVVKVS